MKLKLNAHSIGIYVLIILLALLVPTKQQQQQNQNQNQNQLTEQQQRSAGYFDVSDKSDPNDENIKAYGNAANMIKNSAYFQASLPMRIYECLRQFSVLRCTKLFMYQKMEERQKFPNSGNLTSDFMEQFFDTTDQMGSLTTDKYVHMSDKELNQRLVVKFQRFFKNRDIKLHFLPGIMVKVVPSKTNKLTFSLKKKSKPHHAAHSSGRKLSALTTTATKSAETEENVSSIDIEPESSFKGQGGIGGGGGVGPLAKRKHKKHTSYKGAMIQMAVPILIMPAILMGSFLPFLLPALKMATFMSMILNNSAFMAALLYAARTHANAQDEQHITYGSYSHGVGGSSYH